MHKNRFFLSKDSALKTLMLQEFHESPTGGHTGAERTFLRLTANFYWLGMRRDEKEFVAKCPTCQTIKYSTTAPYGLLQPLEMPERVWEDLALDFIVGLPLSQGNTTILVVIDQFTKHAHFEGLPTSYTATKMAELFCNMVIKLHSLPRTILSDQDLIFTSKFW